MFRNTIFEYLIDLSVSSQQLILNAYIYKVPLLKTLVIVHFCTITNVILTKFYKFYNYSISYNFEDESV